MGIPSIAIYASELISSYQVRRLIRVGSCGALQPDLKLRDIVLAMSASTDSSFNKLRLKLLNSLAGVMAKRIGSEI
jgi:purine-nucleoside phosphorylase